jgi:transcriptional regulator with GAF, ATPase, and Fis domain
MKVTLPPGSYTIHLLNPGALAEALVEVYDLSQDAGTQLSNLSCRLSLAAGETVIVGAVLSGPLHFLRRAADRHGVDIPTIRDSVRRLLVEADWPGNIRELAHFAERVALSLDDNTRAPDHGLSLPDRVNRFESELLRDALQSHRGDISAVLAEMQVPRKTLYDKLQRHGLKPADFR